MPCSWLMSHMLRRDIDHKRAAVHSRSARHARRYQQVVRTVRLVLFRPTGRCWRPGVQKGQRACKGACSCAPSTIELLKAERSVTFAAQSLSPVSTSQDTPERFRHTHTATEPAKLPGIASECQRESRERGHRERAHREGTERENERSLRLLTGIELVHNLCKPKRK